MWRKTAFLSFLIFTLSFLLFPLTGTQAQCLDSDRDEICDNQDPCPNDRTNTCNTDSDGDGIIDSQDRCPNDRSNTCNSDGGSMTNLPDRDGDGTEDSQDSCPDAGGPAQNNGCPLPPDRDGDGTEDSQDSCPDAGGPDWNNGCPENEQSANDSDGDSVPDGQDSCPNQAGVGEYQGCLPPLPDDGACVAATNSNQRANIRHYPDLTSEIIGRLGALDIVPVIERIDTPDNRFYRTDSGWIAGSVLRFAGDCEKVENPQPDPNCEDETTEGCHAPILEEQPENECGDVLNPVVVGLGGVITTNDSKGEPSSFQPYGPSYTGGVNVATGDVNGDGTPDIITGTGAGVAAHVKVFDGSTGAEIYSFFAYPSFTGGVYVAAGDVNGDGFADIITGAGAGAPGGHVKVFDGATGAEIRSFFAYDPGFMGGVRVAAGDVNGDGIAEIITSPAGSAGPYVKVFDGATNSVLASFFAFSPGFTGGVTVAVGDLNGDCKADIVTGAGAGAGPHVKVFSGADMSLLASFFAYAPSFTGGVNVAIADGNSDGQNDVITFAPTPAGTHVKVFDGLSFGLIESYLV